MLNILLLQTTQESAELLTDVQPVEKTLSILELISSGGVAGQVLSLIHI